MSAAESEALLYDKPMARKRSKERRQIIDGRTYRYRLKRNRRAKRLILRVDPAREVWLVVPWGVSEHVAEEFFRSKVGWLERINKGQDRKSPDKSRQREPGSFLQILGDVKQLAVRVEATRQRAIYKEEGNMVQITIPHRALLEKAITAWYRERARLYVSERADYVAGRLGVAVKKIVISNARSQWGSCIKSKGRISIQWRLAQAPLGVMDYVVAHEVTHLRWRGHTREFWRAVEKVCPDWRERKRWLRESGYKLYGFDG